jgi:phage tail sheath protein FI
MLGATSAGPNFALVRSLTEFVSTFADRTVAAAAIAYDAADVYFREGGNQLYVSRTDAAGGLAASGADLEAMTRAELDALAVEKGLDPADYSTKSDEIAALSGPGTLALDAGITAALGYLTRDLGPGQVFIADPVLAADPANQSALLAHAQACNRVALLSTADGDESALSAAGLALQTDANSRYGALFAPSAVIPGVVAGTTRTVPYSAVEAGIISRNDVSYNPNIAAAGVLGQAVYALDVNGRYTDAEYQTLNDSSVDMARVIYGGVRTYGYRTCVDPVAAPEWLDLGWARLNMAITAQAEAIGEGYVFSQLDGRGRTLAQFGADLSAMLAGYYDAGALYGETPQDAYNVDVGSTVNTPTTIANGELHAVIEVRMSPFAEWVVIEIVKVDTTQSLPAVAA